MAQIYNAGDDFVKSFSAGVQARMTDAQREMEQERQAQLLPAQKEHLKAEIQHLEQEQESAKQLMGLHYENYKSELYKQFKEGTRKMAFGADQKPEASQVQIGAATGLKNAPPEIQQAFAQQMQQPGAMAGPTQTDQLANPSSTQTVDVDKRIDPTGQMTLPNVVSPQDAFKQKVSQQVIENQLAAQKAGMEEEAKTAPKISVMAATQKAKFEGQTNLQTQKDAAAKERADEANALKQQLNDANNTSRMAVAKVNAAARMHAAATKAKIDPEEMANSALMAGFGQNDLTGNTPNVIAQRKILSDAHMVPVTKDQVSKLSVFHGLDPINNLNQQLVEMLPDSKAGAILSNIKSHIVGSDIKNKVDEINSFVTNVVQTFGVKNRINKTEIDSMKNFLVQPGVTKQQAADRLNLFANEVKSKVLDDVLHDVPAHQKVMLLQKNGFDPGQFQTSYKDAKGRPLSQYKLQNDGNWSVLTDPQKGLYTAVDDVK